MSERVIRRVFIHGLVQGVGYRQWTRHVARRRGVEGWVRNREDGSVEAVFAGTAEVVSAMIQACHVGPPHGRVERVDAVEAMAIDLDDRGTGETFSILPTA